MELLRRLLLAARRFRPPHQQILQIPPGVALLHRRHILRRALGDDLAAAVAALGAEVDVGPLLRCDGFQFVDAGEFGGGGDVAGA